MGFFQTYTHIRTHTNTHTHTSRPSKFGPEFLVPQQGDNSRGSLWTRSVRHELPDGSLSRIEGFWFFLSIFFSTRGEFRVLGWVEVSRVLCAPAEISLKSVRAKDNIREAASGM